MAQQQMGQMTPQGQPQQAPPQPQPQSGVMGLGNAGPQQLQPDYGSKQAEQTPLNDRVYHGGELTALFKRLLLERQQARAAASAQYQRGQLEQNSQM
jgi:hypothetical protein